MNLNHHLQHKTAIVLKSENAAVLSIKRSIIPTHQTDNVQTFQNATMTLNTNQEITQPPLTESVLL